MSIFGSSGSKFIYPETSTSVYLTHSVIYPDWMENDYEVNTAIDENRQRWFYTLGDYSEFKIKMNLSNFPVPIDKFNELYFYNQKEVQFFPHWDGEPIKNSTATATASFYIECKLGSFDKYNTHEYLEMNFKPTTYTTINELSSSVPPVPPSDDPSAIDPGNIILLLDGDKDLAAKTWKNQVGDLANMNFTLTPTINATGVNGHGTVKFGGVFASGDNGIITTPTLGISAGAGSHEYTTYFVFYQHTISGNRYIFSDGVNYTRHKMSQVAGTTTMQYAVNTANIPLGVSNITGKWIAVSATIKGGVGNSSVRSYYEDGADTGRVAGNYTVTLDPAGICIGGISALYGECNVEFAYVMFRSGTDSVEIQNQIFDAIKLRFGI